MTAIAQSGADPAGITTRRVRRRPTTAWVGTLPFIGYVGLFLLLPTGIIIWNAFKNPAGAFTLSGISALGGSAVRSYFVGSFELAGISSVSGAVLGAVLAYAVASGPRDGIMRRLYLSGSGVLAQFGGVTLAFAFLVTIGPTTGYLLHAGWYYSFPWGISLIYIYFQIPLMVLVFLPAIDGLKVQWREAAENLGGSTWHYWRHIGGPLLTPAFLGGMLLLFANGLSA